MRLFPNRRYKTGTESCLWRWTDVLLEGVPYLVRLHLAKLQNHGAVMLHWILKADPQPDLHDHPVNFLSIVLWGGYVELTSEGFRRIRFWNYKRATDSHKIVHVRPNTLTLVFAGKKVREWGFHTPKGFIPWTEYDGV